MEINEPIQSCSCKCHFGGAISCPSCKKNHEKNIKCEHCMKE